MNEPPRHANDLVGGGRSFLMFSSFLIHLDFRQMRIFPMKATLHCMLSPQSHFALPGFLLKTCRLDTHGLACFFKTRCLDLYQSWEGVPAGKGQRAAEGQEAFCTT